MRPCLQQAGLQAHSRDSRTVLIRCKPSIAPHPPPVICEHGCFTGVRIILYSALKHNSPRPTATHAMPFSSWIAYTTASISTSAYPDNAKLGSLPELENYMSMSQTVRRWQILIKCDKAHSLSCMHLRFRMKVRAASPLHFRNWLMVRSATS